MNKFLRSIIAFSLKNRYFIFFCTGLLLITGIITFRNMPIEAFPDVTNTEISIITQWPGRSAEEIEKFVTIPVEIAMNPVQQKISLRSTSIFGLSYVKLIFEDGVVDKDARAQVNALLQNVTLPEGIQPQVQPPTGPTGEIYRYTLQSKLRDDRELKTMQDWIIDRQLRSVPGVGDIVSFGGRVKTYEIQVDPGKLTNLGITPLDVFNAVGKRNINVTTNNGIPVLVKDVANVVISNVPRLGRVGRADAVEEPGNGPSGGTASPSRDRHRQVIDQDDVVE